jgi:hypothetical protein
LGLAPGNGEHVTTAQHGEEDDAGEEDPLAAGEVAGTPAEQGWIMRPRARTRQRTRVWPRPEPSSPTTVQALLGH